MKRVALTAAGGALLAAVVVFFVTRGGDTPVEISEAQPRFEESIRDTPQLLTYYDPAGERLAVDWVESEGAVSWRVDPATGVLAGLALLGDRNGVLPPTQLTDPEAALSELARAGFVSCVRAAGAAPPALADHLPQVRSYESLGYQATEEADGSLTYEIDGGSDTYRFEGGKLIQITLPYQQQGGAVARIDVAYPEREFDLEKIRCP